jgi:hypothetical protein
MFFGVLALCLSLNHSRRLVSTENWRISKTENRVENGENGEALALCEKARIAHAAMISRYIAMLVNRLNRASKKVGDDIDAVREVLMKRGENDVVAIIDKVWKRRRKIAWQNRSRVVSWLKKNSAYPERRSRGEGFTRQKASKSLLFCKMKRLGKQGSARYTGQRYDLATVCPICRSIAEIIIPAKSIFCSLSRAIRLSENLERRVLP